MIKKKLIICVIVFATCSIALYAQTGTNSVQSSEDAKAKSDADQEKKATEWVASLNLNDAEKVTRVKTAIYTHLKTIRDWHNEHPFTTVPAGINPATGNRLSDLDRQVIANSAMPKSVHEDLMNALNKDLSPEQV